VAAELLALVLSDEELRSELIERGRARAPEFAPDRVEAQIREAVKHALQGQSL
jgi:hypothetical protein